MTEWFETFFDALAHDVWRGLVPDAHSDAEAAFVLDALGLVGAPGAAVLDVPSGDGRIAERLAAQGCAVTAVDLSEVAVRRASHLPGVTARRADLRRLDAVLGDTAFDGACCLGNSFGYLDDAGTKAFLASVARHLRPAARFVLDVPVAAECVLPALSQHDVHRNGDVCLTITTRYDTRTSTLVGEMVLERGDERAQRTVWHRVLTAGEVTRLLGSAGLAVVGQYGGIDGAPFAVGAPTLIVVAERT